MVALIIQQGQHLRRLSRWYRCKARRNLRCLSWACVLSDFNNISANKRYSRLSRSS
ncbi:hypothetical protein KIN20_034127 [Parelaphostrongylus tenuis]|uniref:Uncharacterized protein n=1 Tax=Parelaphostrongylus tenuis TaxID=148309 RepID=A0AAD5WJF6_PARTN|nr:hypothetical protein KIN20_034127 [Parelaphostrongylus tenuis]